AGPVAEGSRFVVSLTSPVDPSSVDTAAGFHYAFACNGASLAGSTYALTGTTSSASCFFDDGPSNHTVRMRVIDKDGGFTEYTPSVHVDNVAPTATLANDGPINEGASATVSFSNKFDPSGPDTTAGFHYAYACDGSSLAGSTYAGSSAIDHTSCSFDDGPSSHTVKARILDKDGGFTEYTTDVTVKNVPPTADLANDGPINEGGSAMVTFSNPSDPSNADTAAGFRYAFSCGDGDLSGATYAGSSAIDQTRCSFDDDA